MKQNFKLNAQPRVVGRGASRRLRREAQLPAIVYGAGKDAQALTLNHNEIWHALENEAFYSSILDLQIGNDAEQVVLKDIQRHPYKAKILHVDFLRILADQEIHMHVPLHFTGVSPAIKQGGIVTHLVNEVEVVCLPRNLPEYIEVDLSNLELNQTIHLSELKRPEGVKLASLLHGNDQGVVNVHEPRAVKEDEEAAAASAAAPAEGAAPAPGGAPAAPAAEKKDEKK